MVATVYAVAMQPDGKVLVGGGFRDLIVRINPDETLDGNFNSEVSGSSVRSLALLADGKILVGGGFTRLGGQSRNNLGRFHADRTLDTTFDPGANSQVDCLAVQPDGRILVSGLFTTLAGHPRNRIGRLNTDGTLDATFDPGANARVYSLAVQADGKILVGGQFTSLGGEARDRIARLNVDGTLDAGFTPEVSGGGLSYVSALAVQADGKILVGGQFTNLGGQARDRLARLNADGTLDTDFDPGADSWVASMVVQADGKIVVGGAFTTLGGEPRSRIARLNADGTLDSAFDPVANNAVFALALQGDGKALAGGEFSNMGGQPRIRLARLNSTAPATQTLNQDGVAITWMRSGSGPEVSRASFEHSTDGLGWSFLGHGTRMAGGWELSGLSVPPSGTLRARGYVAGGYFNGSGSFVEGYFGRPILLSQPESRTNAADSTAIFRVVAGPDETLGYHWLKNGLPLVNQAGISGANGSILSLSNVLGAAGGSYSVVVSNRFGSVTSAPATLTVNDPYFTFDLSRIAQQELGGTERLLRNVQGTAPLKYQWYHDDVAVPGATGLVAPSPNSSRTLSLTLSNLAFADAGVYTVVASNAYGSVTSLPTFLSVNGATLDVTFASFNLGTNTTVVCMAVQPDGKILVGGGFSTFAGQPRRNIARLNADGTLDGAFNPGADVSVTTLLVQPDGKILAGGGFTNIGGQPRAYIARLNTDGTLDTGFNPGADGGVLSLTLQADGKILVGGNFKTLGGQARHYIGRLNGDGTLDSSFNPGASHWVYSVIAQANGKILVSGTFTNLAGQVRPRVGRLNENGTLDAAFDPQPNGHVESLAIQADGRILIAGNFTTLRGQPRHGIGRLNEDGTLDHTFDPGASGLSGNAGHLAVQADGKVVVSGIFDLGRQFWNYLARLNADGTLDFSFNPAVGLSVRCLTVQADGRILLGGGFTDVMGQTRDRIARLDNTGPATQSLTRDGSTVRWLRSGSGPEVWRTTFEHSGDGVTWTILGSGTRLPDGWQLTGVSVPSGGSQRVRGYVAGDRKGSGWFLEDYFGRPVIVTQPVGEMAFAGSNTVLRVSAGGTSHLTYQWYHDGAPVPGAVGPSLNLEYLSRSDAGLYTVVVSNTDGSVTSTPALLKVSAPVTVDDSFNPGVRGGTVTEYFPNPFVNTLAVQADGKILVGGNFSDLGGQHRNYIGRLNRDGTLDDSFSPDADHWVDAIAIQADGKILVGGSFFSALGGQTRYRIGRLYGDGALDESFDPGVAGDIFQNIFFPSVRCLAVQSDGKILVGGNFAGLGGLTSKHARLRIGRLHADGTLDKAFNPKANDQVRCLAIQPDGMILVGGDFTKMGKTSRNYIARLKANGTLDTKFNPGASNEVYAIAVQADGKILVGGRFTNLAGQPRNYIGRLNSDGTLDGNFDPKANGSVTSFSIQTDGKILVSGYFSNLGGQTRAGIARLNADGTLDASLNLRANDGVNCLALTEDGRILVAGEFTTLNGQPRARIGRLINSDPATQTLDQIDSTITWSRGGTGPEAWRTTFEQTTNGVNWTTLGTGTRIPGGWQRAGTSLPSDRTVRARGQVMGSDKSSGSFVEDYFGRPAILTQPASVTNGAGAAATFHLAAVGSEPLSYRWLKDGNALSDEGKVTGPSNVSLALNDVRKSDEGAYRVVVSNSFGSVTSAVAMLTVLNPLIVEHPLDTHRNAGEEVTLNGLAAGVPTPSYQWYHDGVALPGAVNSSLTLDNLSVADAGLYTVVASNSDGSVASDPAMINVNGATVDADFNPRVSGGILGGVNSLLVQANGKILVGGDFNTLDGYSIDFLGRLGAAGMLDAGFLPWPDWQVFALAIQADGKILVGGGFTSLTGRYRGAIGRLNADGTLDEAFRPEAGGGNGVWYDDSFEGTVVYAVSVQTDGKILVGGNFKTMNGQKRSRIARLNPDGNLDTAFKPAASGGYSSAVRCLAVQADGKILVGGEFTSLGGKGRKYFGRLNPDGKLDSTFNPAPNDIVHSVAVQPDGRILLGGEFTALGKQPRSRIARLNANGTLDSTFNPVANSAVYSLVLQEDGKILVGGSFTNLGGQTRRGIARLNADGTLDDTVSPVVQGSVRSIALQGDNKILLGGVFGTVAGQQRSFLARLNNTEPTDSLPGYRGIVTAEMRLAESEDSENASARLAPDVDKRSVDGTSGSAPSLPAGGTATTLSESANGHQASSRGGISDISPPIQLNVAREGSMAVLNWTGGIGPYQLQQTTDLSQPDSWRNVGAPTHANSMVLPIGIGSLFLRVLGQ